MILTLCGSTKFESAFHFWNEQLTLKKGYVVFSLSIFPSWKTGEREWYTPDQKAKLDMVHKDKIEASEGIFVITGSYLHTGKPYIDSSTQSEINYAIARNKAIYYDYNSDHLRALFGTLTELLRVE